MADLGEDAPLASGHSLIPMMKLRLAAPPPVDLALSVNQRHPRGKT
jgi:hypothetical protein